MEKVNAQIYDIMSGNKESIIIQARQIKKKMKISELRIMAANSLKVFAEKDKYYIISLTWNRKKQN